MYCLKARLGMPAGRAGRVQIPLVRTLVLHVQCQEGPSSVMLYTLIRAISYITLYLLYSTILCSVIWVLSCIHINAVVHMYMYVYIYIYNYRPSFCIVNTVSNQLFRQVRILYLSITTENKLGFQENVSLNSFRFDVRSGSCISQGLPKSISHVNRTCQSTHSSST